MSSFLFLVLTLTCLTLDQCWGQAYWAYDPLTGQTFPYGHHTSSEVVQPTRSKSSSTHHSKAPNLYNPFGSQTNNPFFYPFIHPLPPPGQGCVPTPPPKIDWGDCPMLEGNDESKMMKEERQKECIKDLELNENATLSSLSPVLQDRVRECVLRKNELLNEAGKYNYDKAMEKLTAKGLPEELTKKVEEAHIECKVDASQKFLNSEKPLAEVEAYQDCMDLHLIMLCKIKVVKNPETITSVNSFHGIPADTNSAMGNPASRQAAAGTAGGGGSVHTHDFSNVMDKIQVLSQALRR